MQRNNEALTSTEAAAPSKALALDACGAEPPKQPTHIVSQPGNSAAIFVQTNPTRKVLLHH